jgi:biopolymer transport protein ExbD
VVNVREDGTFTAEDFNTICPTRRRSTIWSKPRRRSHQTLGIVSKLHLRGDKEAVFRHCRTAIRGAARAGVDQVVFAVFVREP